ncbi:hypothetical protein NIES4072_74520 [Nostoc commune NIES-4072]|uniref:Uncharacterized protein n=1 Tax=Nostoc commune NIES-4072 TaxID=2005467 RepID=A0A2R5FYD8_NOSCO|nr:hypothetical protein [Nostoc commune]BBD71040.1 hypothetical protein NIES4070_74510 [Nostoc commune HK-02]GBG23740.1 hypothetical protein NIES4072_74520 [Nostoc commune NIES-4072]
MNNIETSVAYWCLVTEVNNKIGALVVTYLASKTKLSELYQNQDWFDSSLSRGENKDRMKRTGGALTGYQSFLTELTIIGLSKTIEDIIVGIKEELNFSYNIWKDNNITSAFHKEAKIVRSLNNVIKHNYGYIRKINEPSGKYLVEECGYPDDFQVCLLESSSSTVSFDMIQEIAQIYIYLLNLLAKVANQPVSPMADISGNMKEIIVKRFIPEHLYLDFKQ